jgi:hypothetical protein
MGVVGDISPWFPISAVLMVLMLLRERQHIADMARHTAEFNEFIRESEKRLAEVRESLVWKLSPRLKTLYGSGVRRAMVKRSPHALIRIREGGPKNE